DGFYWVLFSTLPWLSWQGAWLLVLAGVLVAEIVLTLTDFVVEITVRKPFGDVYAGERVTHAIMGILYGAMVAKLIPVMLAWSARPTGLVFEPAAVAPFLRVCLTIMGGGVLLSGVRDFYAAFDLPHGSWPWPREPIRPV